jgi:hypothetical protein
MPTQRSCAAKKDDGTRWVCNPINVEEVIEEDRAIAEIRGELRDTDGKGVRDHECSKLSDQKSAVLKTKFDKKSDKKLENGQPKSVVFCMSKSMPAPTVTSTMDIENSYYAVRRANNVVSPPSVREAARFQGFPDSFVFCANGVQSKMLMVADGVPPPFSHRIFQVRTSSPSPLPPCHMIHHHISSLGADCSSITNTMTGRAFFARTMTATRNTKADFVWMSNSTRNGGDGGARNGKLMRRKDVWKNLSSTKQLTSDLRTWHVTLCNSHIILKRVHSGIILVRIPLKESSRSRRNFGSSIAAGLLPLQLQLLPQIIQKSWCEDVKFPMNEAKKL